MGSTEPEMLTVMFGCVSTMGAVVTEASWSLSAVDMTNGRDGTVRLSVAGAGFTTVAEAVMVSGEEDTL